MFEVIRESGIAGWAALLLTIAGAAAVTTIGRRRARPGSVAASWAVVVLACGALGMAMGQRMVDRAVRGSEVAGVATSRPLPHWTEQDLPRRVSILSIGTREASANLYLSAAGALLLCVLGGALALMQKEPGVKVEAGKVAEAAKT
jgi:hypothetical protein